jgi:hypothetical protein
MSYEIRCLESHFRVSDPDQALAALKAENRHAALFDFEDVPAKINAAATLCEALEACGWDAEVDGDERIAALFYEGNLLTDFDDIERLFRVLARFVEAGSFLLICGEDNACFRYAFKNRGLRIQEVDAPTD